MIVIQKRLILVEKSLLRCLPRAGFSYDHGEIKKLEMTVKRKLQVLRMYSDLKDFDYEAPTMSYDKKSGEIIVEQGKGAAAAQAKEAKKKVIGSIDDLEKEKRALFAEMGLDDEGKPKNANEPIDKLADKLKAVQDRMMNEFDLDPTAFQVFSRDFMRVDVGLMIQRPPIFLTVRDRDVKFLKYKNDIMNEYYCNAKQFSDEFEEVSKLNEDILADNPYSSKMNLDNYPTHKVPGSNPAIEYAAASKYFGNVDPNMQDRKTIHYAAEDRTYMIVRNRYTLEWEFPTGKMNFGQTFMRGKQNLFNVIAHDPSPQSSGIANTTWKVKYFGNAPIAATIREFTQAERVQPENKMLKGVRTFFFQAHHWRGLPSISPGDLPEAPNHDYDDFAWVPKRQLNEYFSKDYFEVFAKATSTR